MIKQQVDVQAKKKALMNADPWPHSFCCSASGANGKTWLDNKAKAQRQPSRGNAIVLGFECECERPSVPRTQREYGTSGRQG